MDRKTSLLRRKRLHSVNSEAGISIKGNEGKVACLVYECNAKDKLMANHLKTAQEIITGREKTKAEVAIYKQDLQDTSQQNIHTNKRLVHLNPSINNCRQQFSSSKERAHKRLESRYTEARKKLTNLTVENVKKKELIKNVSNQMSEATTEYHVLKKELKIRTRNADVANRQHQETTNLEAERQRLRLLVKKRVPGHEKTKSVIKKLSEVEEENRTLKESLCEREKEIRNLKGEIDKIYELENKIVNLNLMYVELDQQLSASKVEIKEAFRKVSVLEMELEDKCQQYEGLETTCLELQLQLATVSSKKEVTEDVKQIQTVSSYEGLETSQATELTNNKKLTPHSSLRELLNSPTIKEILTTTEDKDPSVPHYSTCNRSCGLKNVVPKAWPIVPRAKRSKGIELIWKVLLRRKKGGNKKKVHRHATYHI